jgi:5-methylcytosine-specific restriction endonuclease McrA
MARYRKTEDYKQTARLRQARSRRTEKHQTRMAQYRQSEKYRGSKVRYRQSETGKFVAMRYARSYARSETGRAVFCKAAARRRARRRGANVLEPVDRREILRLDDLCHLCDLPVDPQAFHLDHVIPLAVEPIEAPWNAAVAHPTCNVRKHARLVPLSPAARFRWQQRRPAHLALLDAYLTRIAA